MLHQLLIAVIVHRIQISLHGQALFQPLPLLLAHTPAELFIQAVQRLVGHDLGVFVPGQLQNVGAHGSQPFGLLHHGVCIGPPLLRCQVVVLQQLGKSPDGDKRRFELVGKGIHKVHSQQRHAGQFLRHFIKAADIFRHLAPGAPHIHPHGIIALRHRLRGLHQP